MSKKAIQIIAGVFLFSLVYAIFRYHVFEDVPGRDFALYVLNKSIGLSALILLTINFGLGPAKALGADVPDPWLESRKEIGIFAFMQVLAHMLLSVLAFGSGGYYAKFFVAEGGLTAIGSWSMLLGVLAFVWLWLYNISFKTHQEGDQAFLRLLSSKRSLIFAGLLAGGHVAVMGFKGWMNPGGWAGGMPPITLVAFAVFVIGLLVNLFGRK